MVRDDETTQVILKKMSRGDVEGFAKKKKIFTVLRKNLCAVKTQKGDHY